jgi:predicted ATPase with chaperone activity
LAFTLLLDGAVMSSSYQLLELRERLREIIRNSDISASMHPLTETLMLVEWKLEHPSFDLDLDLIGRDLKRYL